MRKARSVLEAPKVVNRPTTGSRQSDQRLRRLIKRAQRASDPRKQAELKEQFIREFYQGAS